MFRFIALLLLVVLPLGNRAVANGGGTIAYVRNGTEIRLIDADGSNDRRLWTHPDAKRNSVSMTLRGVPMEKNSPSPAATLRSLRFITQTSTQFVLMVLAFVN